MFCNHCGKEVAEDVYVCPHCGEFVCFLDPSAEVKETPREEKKTRRREKVAKASLICTKIGRVFTILNIVLLAIMGFGALIFALAVTTDAIDQETFAAGTGLVMFLVGWYFAAAVATISADVSTAAFVLGLVQKYDDDTKKVSRQIFITSLIVYAVTMSAFTILYVCLYVSGVLAMLG